jgi:signal transduction histidine kinase
VSELLHDAFRARLMRRMGHAVQHDLRSPVQGLSMCLDLVQKSIAGMAAGDPARVAIEKAVSMARRELERMEQTSRDLLTDAGILEEEATRFDLAQLTRDVAHHFRTEAAMRGVELVLDMPAQPVHVNGSRSEIGRAILVCIVDALDTVPDGGRAEVEVRGDGGHASVVARGGVAGNGERVRGEKEASFASMGLEVVRECVVRLGGEFVREDSPGARRATVMRLPLER